jgi:hypothetical protein
MNIRAMILIITIAVLCLIATACNATANVPGKPVSVITAPPSNSKYEGGEEITINSSSADPAGIARVELLVDGIVIQTNPAASPQLLFTAVHQWSATAGTHIISVRAVNIQGVASDPATISVQVAPAVSVPATPTRLPNVACTKNAIFVADVTVPDGTVLSPGQTVNKIWRVRNSGNCAWSEDDQLVFARGENMSATKVLAVPSTAPGETVDLLVAFTAPTTPGKHQGDWRFKNKSGAFFGSTLTMLVNVPSPISTQCPFTPVIESFSVSPQTIVAGQSAVLKWGAVIGAERADIDNDIGGVATPGNVGVTPVTTTTYTLTATCGTKVRTAQATVNVTPAQ